MKYMTFSCLAAKNKDFLSCWGEAEAAPWTWQGTPDKAGKLRPCHVDWIERIEIIQKPCMCVQQNKNPNALASQVCTAEH
jgi:hypothetical protein